MVNQENQLPATYYEDDKVTELFELVFIIRVQLLHE